MKQRKIENDTSTKALNESPMTTTEKREVRERAAAFAANNRELFDRLADA